MTDTTPASNDAPASIASVAAEPLAVDASTPAKSLGESLYPAPAESQPAPEPAPAGVDASTEAAPVAEGGEGKETGEKPADDSKPAEGDAPALLTAESYADLKIADGFEVNDAALTDAKAIFAEAQVPPEAAQKLLDLYTTNLKTATDQLAAAHQEQFTALNQQWIDATNALPEMQGEAKKQTLAILGRTMDEFGSPEAREAFNLTGAGNNPHIVKYILSLAQAVVEGAPTPQGAPALSDPRKGKSLGQRLYPNSN